MVFDDLIVYKNYCLFMNGKSEIATRIIPITPIIAAEIISSLFNKKSPTKINKTPMIANIARAFEPLLFFMFNSSKRDI